MKGKSTPYALRQAMDRAENLAATPGVPHGPNPRVGCVIMSANGEVLGEGYHRGAGTPHAEVAAIADCVRRGNQTQGATAVVTLEPCSHHGHTGPCTEALLKAGIARVVVGRLDPNPVASGGAQALRTAGVDVYTDTPSDPELNRGWEHGLRTGRPFVTAKIAATLDGFVAAADGSSQWITSVQARADGHRLRGANDVIVVGTGTALADTPSLTARDNDGRLLEHQPLRAVMGLRVAPLADVGAASNAGASLRLVTRDPHAALDQLFAAGYRDVLIEGGPHLVGAFLREGLVDQVIYYLAPRLLGAGLNAAADLRVDTLSQSLDFQLLSATPLTEPDGSTNLRLVLQRKEGACLPD